jgi:adenylate cyclase
VRRLPTVASHKTPPALSGGLAPRAHDRQTLQSLLTQRNQQPEQRAQIDDAITQAFVRPVAMLVLDMCGFSRITASHGIIHFLALIHRMEHAARPAIAANGGEVVKQEADNLFAVFTHPQNALEAALDILRALDAMNTVQPAESQLLASVGIGYGPTLVVAGKDLFGHEMNMACKLGEDIAGPGEVLLTQAACRDLEPGRYLLYPLQERMGGMDMPAFRYVASLHERPLPGAPISDA